MTGKDVPALEEAQAGIPAGTRINVTYLGNEDLDMRVNAARAVRLANFKPVPHISARRLTSKAQLEEFLSRLQEAEVSSSVFVVGGDPHTPEGPYSDSAEVIRTGILQEYGVTGVSISGYPEGHPDIKTDVLWGALQEKADSIREQGLEGTILTQFGFDTEPVIEWIQAVRERGIDFPIRVGVPGPAGVKRLLGYARRFGVASSAGIVQKYGFSLANLLGTAGPDRFVADLADRLDGAGLGTVKLHFYTFGGMRATANWATEFVAKQNAAAS
ncbi:methylenetetrahydrofolate reductase [Cryobacterium sp. Hh7]|nr:methylenetetrahydrofolate reductase [Cryobacterium sp. Hh7]TFD59751.1 methylenetetrahydrofolate reductase [Cryobacterium sp. Hh7]